MGARNATEEFDRAACAVLGAARPQFDVSTDTVCSFPGNNFDCAAGDIAGTTFENGITANTCGRVSGDQVDSTAGRATSGGKGEVAPCCSVASSDANIGAIAAAANGRRAGKRAS